MLNQQLSYMWSSFQELMACSDGPCGLQAAGVQVNSFHYKGTFHGFMQFPVPQAKEALEAMSAELRSAFSV